MKMHYYKATIQYIGTNYAGFQWQNGLATVQNETNQALARISDEKISTVAASRTDTGVHAFDQVVKITSAAPLQITAAILNQHLPADIRCMSIHNCSGEFKPSAQTQSKEYRYLFTNKTHVQPEEKQLIANIANPLDLSLMQTCLSMITGTHDFTNFCSAGSNVKSTVRTVLQCELTTINPQEFFSESELFSFSSELQSCYQLKIVANGFLKQMIRHLVSALWMAGSGKISVEEFRSLIDSPKQEKQLWKVAPPNGLFLYKITYAD